MYKIILPLIVALFIYSGSSGQSTLNSTSEDQLYRDGVALMNNGKFVAASRSFEKYLEQGEDPLKIADSKYYIAFCAIQNRNDDGEALIDAFIKEYPENTKASLAYYELGDLKYREKDYTSAIKYFKKLYIEGLEPDLQSEARFKLGYAYFTQKEFDAAYEQFNELKREGDKYQYPASYYSGYINFQKGEYDRAYFDFVRAEKNEAYAPVVPSMIVKVYYKQKRYSELISYGEKALLNTSVKDKSQIYLYLGEAYYMLRNYEKASVNYDHFLVSTKGKADRELLFRIAYVQQKSAKNDQAIDNFKRVAIKQDTLGYYASYYLGNLYLKSNNLNYAVAAYKTAKSGSYDKEIEEDALFKYAKVNLDLGNYDEVISSIFEFKKKYPGSQRVTNIDELLTDAYLNSNNYDAALSYIDKLSVKSDKIKRAYQQIAFYKGTELFNDSKYPQAVEMFDKSLDYPQDPPFVIKSHYWKGEAYSVGLKYEEAVNCYAAVFRSDSQGKSDEYLQARYGIGYAYFNLKDYDKALGHFSYYTSNSSADKNGLKYYDGMIRLGDCYYASKQYQQALSTFDRYLKQDNKYADYACLRKGVIYGILDNLVAANSNFDKVINDYPRSRHIPNAIYQKGRINFENGDYEAGIRYFTRLINDYPQSSYTPYALQNRSIAYTNISNYQGAANGYKEILTKYPNHELAENALLGLQQSLTALGKSSEFSAYMESYKRANPDNTKLEYIEYEAAKSAYYNQQYSDAIRNFKAFISSYPESASLTEARYFLADALYRNDNPEEALQVFHELVPVKSFNKYSRVIQRVAELESQQENFAAAVKFNRLLESVSSSKKEQLSAWQGLMDCYMSLNKYDSVIYYGEEIIEKGQVSVEAENRALLMMGKASLNADKVDDAQDYFLRTLNSAKDEYGAEANYLMAVILNGKQKYRESIDVLLDMNKTFGSYDFWLGKSFLLIAKNNVALKEYFQAKATLQSIIDNSPVSSIVNEAKKDLRELESIAVETDSSAPDTLEIENFD